ncbi:MAG: hypothetical protein K5924_02315 [Chloroflexi bacterium]|nr:hypothetical protein [Chloroflexota bacterium]
MRTLHGKHWTFALAMVVVVVAACSSGTSGFPAQTAEPEATEASPSPARADSPSASADASPTEAAAMALDIPLEPPCHAIDMSAVEALLGEEPVAETEWVPGEKPYGLDVEATTFGCAYEGQSGSDGLEREFALTMAGEEMRVEAWNEFYDSADTCRKLEPPSAIGADAIGALVCPSAIDDWSRVMLAGVFGVAGVQCWVLVPDDEIDPTLEASVMSECARTLIELGS